MRNFPIALSVMLLSFVGGHHAIAKTRTRGGAKTAEAAEDGKPDAAEAEAGEKAKAEEDAARAKFFAAVRVRLTPEQATALDAMTPEAIVAMVERQQKGETLNPIEQAIFEAIGVEGFASSLTYKTGDITLGDKLATLHLGEGLRFLDQADSKKLLEDAWGNPPGNSPLGMIIPTGSDPLSEAGWGIVVSFSEEGFVKDDEEIDYGELLTQMKEDTESENANRTKGGFGAVHLVGWAEPPHFDKANHRLYWAKELDFAGSPAHTLNYSIRVLGRRGVLEFNAVSNMDHLAAVKPAMEDLLTRIEFQAGHRYEDFDPGVDKVAAYGIGALVAGKVLLKVGFFAGILKFLIIAKKAIILGFIALGGLFAKLFKGRSKAPDEPAA